MAARRGSVAEAAPAASSGTAENAEDVGEEAFVDASGGPLTGEETAADLLRLFNSRSLAIRNATSRVDAGGKIRFVASDRTAVHAAVIECQQIMTAMALMAEQAKGSALISAFKAEIEGAVNRIEGAVKTGAGVNNAEKPAAKATKTHAGAAKKPAAKTFAVVVGHKEGGAEAAKAELKKRVENGDLEGGFVTVRKRRDGKLVVAAEKKETIDGLKKAGGKLEVRDAKRRVPVIKLAGVEKGYKDEDILRELGRNTPEFPEGTAKAAVRIKTKRSSFDGKREDWLIEVSPETAARIRRTGGKLNIGLNRVRATEYGEVPRCYRCSGLGHTAKTCRASECCPRCGGAHRLSACKAAESDCTNCRKRSLPSKGHGAHQQAKCAAYKMARDNAVKNTDYGY